MATSKQQSRVSGWVNRWKTRLLLDHWSVTIKYISVDKDLKTEGLKTVATMDPTPRYTDATLEIYPAFFKQPIKMQQATLVHELLHIATHDVREALARAVTRDVISEKKKEDLIEGVTEHWAKTVARPYVRNKKKDQYHL